jgi:repressor LexA
MTNQKKRRGRSGSDLSLRQEQILIFIQNFIRQHSYSPSIRDIQVNLDISSTSVVAYNLKALEEKGKLERENKISRGIKLPTISAAPSIHVPLLGVITAGTPLPNPEDTSDSERQMVNVPAEMIPTNKIHETYALRVRGLSMIDALIDDGDIVLIRYQQTADNGDMVAARLVDDNSFTLKKFYLEGDRVRLQPANASMEPIYTSPDDVQISGRVVGVLRQM